MGADKFIDILGPHKIANLPHVQWISVHLSVSKDTHTDLSIP